MKISNDCQFSIGCGLMILFICIGIGGCTYLERKGQALLNQSEQVKKP